jgi:hypothetical protein
MSAGWGEITRTHLRNCPESSVPTEQNGTEDEQFSPLNQDESPQERSGPRGFESQAAAASNPPQRPRFQRGRWAANLGAKPEAIGKNAALRFGQRQGSRKEIMILIGTAMQIAAKNLHAPRSPRSVLLVCRSKSLSFDFQEHGS